MAFTTIIQKAVMRIVVMMTEAAVLTGAFQQAIVIMALIAT